jgi:hypothetical protein
VDSHRTVAVTDSSDPCLGRSRDSAALLAGTPTPSALCANFFFWGGGGARLGGKGSWGLEGQYRPQVVCREYTETPPETNECSYL